MSFSSFGDFIAMGHHGLFVWTAYGFFAHRRYLQQEFRRLRREENK